MGSIILATTLGIADATDGRAICI